MPVIKIKMGHCIDCPDGAPDKPLTAGRCQPHYWRHRAEVKAAARKGSEAEVDKLEEQRELDRWYVVQIQQMPRFCENCGDFLNPYAPWGAKTYVAHIVEKRNFISVRTHPLNRVFLCGICHTNYDNWSDEKVLTMPVIGKVIERFKCFVDDILASEWHFLPDWLANL